MPLQEWIAGGLAWFQSLPAPMKLMAVVAIATPLLVLRQYLAPPPKAPTPPGDIEILLPDGTKAQGYIKGNDTYIIAKKK